MPSSPDVQRRTTGSITLIVAVAAFLVAVLAVVVVADDSPKQQVDATSTGGLTTPTINVSLSEFKIAPASVTADPGPLLLHVVNDGTMAHNLSVVELGKKTIDLQPGASAELNLGDVAAGHYTIQCNIPGHADSGMRGMLMVGSSSGTGA